MESLKFDVFEANTSANKICLDENQYFPLLRHEILVS